MHADVTFGFFWKAAYLVRSGFQRTDKGTNMLLVISSFISFIFVSGLCIMCDASGHLLKGLVSFINLFNYLLLWPSQFISELFIVDVVFIRSECI